MAVTTRVKCAYYDANGDYQEEAFEIPEDVTIVFLKTEKVEADNVG